MGLIEGVRFLQRRARFLRSGSRPASQRVTGPDRLQEFIPWCSRKRPDGTPIHASPTHLNPLTELLERVLSEQVEICFSVPPRHGKSTTLHYWIAWLLVRDPTRRILYCAYDQTFAEKQVRKAKHIALSVGIAVGDRDTLAEWTTAEGGCVRACGIASPPLGEGFHIVIVDDPHKNRAEAESKKIRDRVVEAFLDDIYTRQEPGGPGTSFVIVHTRWHQDDLIGSLSRKAEDDDVEPFAYVNLPAVERVDDVDVPLAAWLWTLRQLDKFKRRLGAYGWASLFMGQPRPRGDRVFVDAVLCELEDLPTIGVDAIGVDLAHTAKTRSDPQAGLVLRKSERVDSQGQPIFYVVALEYEQGMPLANTLGKGGEILERGFAAKLHDLQRRYAGARTGQYCGANEVSAIELLAALAHTPVYVEPFVALGGRDKFQRAQAVAAAWREGRIIVPRNAPWTDELVRLLVGFTGRPGDRDDLVDALAVAYDMLSGGTGLNVSIPGASETRTAAGMSQVSQPSRYSRRARIPT